MSTCVLPANLDVTLDDIERAHSRIKGDVKQTELLPFAQVPQESLQQKHSQVYLKCENEQRTGSFKVRGAFNALRELAAEQKSCGVVSRSSGNFAQALSLAAKELGVTATIVMPENAPKVKLEGTKRYGAEIVQHGTTTKEGLEKVSEISAERGQVVLSPYDHTAVIAGQGTAALEIISQLPEVENFFCPVGGGGLLAGCAIVLKSFNPNIKIVAVEPEGADDFYRSRRDGKRVSLDSVDTIADGLRTLSVGDKTWPILKQLVDDVVLVSDAQIAAAMAELEAQAGLRVEPSGAAAFAGWRKGAVSLNTGPSVCMLSGANVDKEVYESITSALAI